MKRNDFGFEEGEIVGDVGDVEALRKAYEKDTGTKYSDKIDIKEIEADIRTVYKEVSELPDNTEVNQKSKNSYIEKPNGDVHFLARSVEKVNRTRSQMGTYIFWHEVLKK